MAKRKKKQTQRRLELLFSIYFFHGIFALLLLVLIGFGLSKATQSPYSKLFVSRYSVAEPSDDEAWHYFQAAWNHQVVPIGPFLPATEKTPLHIPTTILHHRKLLKDPLNRVEKLFQVSPILEGRVLFWLNIYAQYDSTMKIVHDRNSPEIVYGYIDYRVIYRHIENKKKRWRAIQKLDRHILSKLRSKILLAAGLKKTGEISVQEKEKIHTFLSGHGALAEPDVKQLVSNLRTQTGQKDMFALAILRSRQLLPHIETQFIQANLPAGLARIPFVESSFNPKANSKGGAVGIWQFVPETAQDMISVNDESSWSDPLIQTRAAIRLLKIYKKILPDWGSSITAYNSGVGRIGRLLKKYRAKNIEQLLFHPKLEGLGFAGRSFYAEVLAAILVEAYKEQIFEPWVVEVEKPLFFDGVLPFTLEICPVPL